MRQRKPVATAYQYVPLVYSHTHVLTFSLTRILCPCLQIVKGGGGNKGVKGAGPLGCSQVPQPPPKSMCCYVEPVSWGMVGIAIDTSIDTSTAHQCAHRTAHTLISAVGSASNGLPARGASRWHLDPAWNLQRDALAKPPTDAAVDYACLRRCGCRANAYPASAPATSPL